MNEKMATKKRESESFFKEAFCVDSAELLLDENLSNFNTRGIIKLTKHNGNVFYLAFLEKIF